MKKKTGFLGIIVYGAICGILILAFIVFSSCGVAYAQSNPIQNNPIEKENDPAQNNSNIRWEYTTIFIETYNQAQIRDSLNSYGQAGWELIVHSTAYRVGPFLVFKRRLP